MPWILILIHLHLKRLFATEKITLKFQPDKICPRESNPGAFLGEALDSG
jgi:hypothetical protein